MTENNNRGTSDMKEFTVLPASYEIQMPICDKQVMCDVSGDFILPDYLPEIKRLLRVTPRVCESSKYVGNGEAQFAGTVDYNVIYADEDGKLYATSLSSDYDFDCKLGERSNDISSDKVYCDVGIESSACRPVGPRKLVIKSRLLARVRAYDNTTIPERTVGAVTAEDEFSLERLRKVCPTVFIARAKGEEQDVSIEMPTDTISGAIKPVFCDAKLSLLEASCVSDGVLCRAELNVRALVESDGGELHLLTKRFPLSETIAVSGAERNCDCRAWGHVNSVTLNVEDSEEAMPKLVCGASVLLEAQLLKNLPVSLCEDAFSTLYECDCSYKDYEIARVLKSVCANFSFAHSLPLSESGISASASILDVCAEAKVDKIERIAGKCVAHGKCKASAIILDGDFDSVEFDIPFKYEFDGISDDISDFEANVEVALMRARIEGENIAIDTEASLSLVLFAKNTESVIDTISLNRNASYFGERSAAFVVYYPDKGDSLWSVAKKYRISPAKIARSEAAEAAALNSTDSLTGKKYIIFEK